MAIDTTGKWWVGTEPSDIREYLIGYTQDAYPANGFRLAQCACGSDTFTLAADDDEGVAKRTCAVCGQEHLICDSAEFLVDAALNEWRCIECNCTQANVGVGFSLYEDGEIHWLHVGERCVGCGVLGCFTGRKVAYSPSRQLMEQV